MSVPLVDGRAGDVGAAETVVLVLLFANATAFVRFVELLRDTLRDAGFGGERGVVRGCRHEPRLPGAFGGHGLVRLLFGLRRWCRAIWVTLGSAGTTLCSVAVLAALRAFHIVVARVGVARRIDAVLRLAGKAVMLRQLLCALVTVAHGRPPLRVCRPKFCRGRTCGAWDMLLRAAQVRQCKSRSERDGQLATHQGPPLSMEDEHGRITNHVGDLSVGDRAGDLAAHLFDRRDTDPGTVPHG